MTKISGMSAQPCISPMKKCMRIKTSITAEQPKRKADSEDSDSCIFTEKTVMYRRWIHHGLIFNQWKPDMNYSYGIPASHREKSKSSVEKSVRQ